MLPSTDRLFVALPCSADRALQAPAEPSQDLPEMAFVVRRQTRLGSGEPPRGNSTAASGSRAPKDHLSTVLSSVPAMRRLTVACARPAQSGARQRCPANDNHPPNGSHFAAPLSPAARRQTDSTIPPPPAARPSAVASPAPQNLVVLLSDSSMSA